MFKLLIAVKSYLVGSSQLEKYYANLITANKKEFPNFAESKLDFTSALKHSFNPEIN